MKRRQRLQRQKFCLALEDGNAEGRWRVKSNVESGIGYTDILVEIQGKEIGCIIEVKWMEKQAFGNKKKMCFLETPLD